MKTAWKHGVVGVVDSDSPQTSEFYRAAKQQRDLAKKAKDFIKQHRGDRK